MSTRALGWLAPLLLAGACGGEERTLMALTVSLPLGGVGQIAALRVQAAASGERTQFIREDLADRFAFWLPPGARGEVAVTLDALDQSQCALASAHAAVAIGTDPVIELGLLLARLPMRRCPLTIHKDGRGSGLVFASTGGLSCGDRCSAELPVGTPIVLTANPDPPFQARFSAPCAGSGPCSLQLSGPTTVGVTLAPLLAVRVTRSDTEATIQSTPPGISCGSRCAAQFLEGEVVRLSATPAQGCLLAWSGPCTGSGACEFLLSAPVSVDARFGPCP